MKISRALNLLIIFGMFFAPFGCSKAPALPTLPAAPSSTAGTPQKSYPDLIIGFAQLGAESEWRIANTKSIKETASELGIELRFSDAQQNQDKQIEAVRKLIIQKVDVIGISPIVESGWKDVFQEAMDAGIPIIMVDRRANVPENLYAAYLGSDFLEEGRKAGLALAKLVQGEAKIVELEGTPGSAPANDRFKGFREVLKDYPGMKIIASESGDFTRARGKEVMEGFLKMYGQTITALYAHNDDMALGAIEAIEAHGLRPGVDIKIISIDASHGAFEAMIEGKLNATIECNPLLGPQFFALALKVVNGEVVPKWVPSIESIFFPEDAAQMLPTRKY